MNQKGNFQLWGRSRWKNKKKFSREWIKFFPLCSFFSSSRFTWQRLRAMPFEHQNPSVLLNHRNRFHLACFCLSCERLFQDIDDGGRRIMAKDAAHVSSGWHCEHLCIHIKLSAGMNTKKKSPFVLSVPRRRRMSRCNYCERIKFSFLSFNYSTCLLSNDIV